MADPTPETTVEETAIEMRDFLRRLGWTISQTRGTNELMQAIAATTFFAQRPRLSGGDIEDGYIRQNFGDG